jgi:anti-sigma factor RsiW
MSSQERMLKLMAYADGELEGPERGEVEGWLAEDAKAVRFTNEIANLGDLVKVGHQASPRAKAVASFDIADLVMAEVTKASPVEKTRTDALRVKAVSPVSSLDAARVRRQKTAKVGAVFAAALALAASVFLVNRSREERPMAQAPVQAVQQGQPVANAGSGVDVDVVETPGHSVSVFYVPTEGMSTTTTSVVVWVDESGGE